MAYEVTELQLCRKFQSQAELEVSFRVRVLALWSLGAVRSEASPTLKALTVSPASLGRCEG